MPDAASTPAPTSTGSTSQQCGGIADPFCYVIEAFISGPVELLGSLDGSPDPAHISPTSGAITAGPWRLITTLVGANPVVDNYGGELGGPVHECGPQGCIPWVQELNAVLEPLSLSLLVLAFTIQVCLFMAGQQLNLRAGLLPCLVAAGVMGAGLPLHLAGRVIDAGSWASQAILHTAFGQLGDHSKQPLDLMTVLAVTAYCPEDSPLLHPGIHLSEPLGPVSRQVLVLPWMDPHFSQSHCLSSADADFAKEVLDRSENFFGPPLHDANCDRGDAAPTQPLCTDTDDEVNDNAGQECLEGTGGTGLGSVQLNALPLPGEPRAGDGQNPADCRYADIYWGTVPTFTDVWAGVGPHGRNGYDVPDGLQGMLAFTVLTALALWLALTYLARYITLALLAGCASLSFLLLALPGGREPFSRYWRTVAGLSSVVVVQTLIFLVFVAIVSTVSGLAPAPAASSLGGCPLLHGGAGACPGATAGLLGEVGRGDPGDQFAKCLLAIATVWLMLTLPRHLSRSEFATGTGLRALAGTTAGVVVGGAMMATQPLRPQVARFGSRLPAAGRAALGLPGPREQRMADELEHRDRQAQSGWPQVQGRETREHFIGRALATGAVPSPELRRLGITVGGAPGSGVKPPGPEELAAAGRSYIAGSGSRLHDLDVAYLNSLRRGRLRPLPGDPPDQTRRR
ncbi:MAG: hypothetical protein ACREN4_04960 [Candidatus Dormibacteria bacterium]